MRERLPVLGGVVLALSGEPEHETAWARGAEGEAKLARYLQRKTRRHGVILLHDRRLPTSRGNFDHLAVGPAGVTVIDAKRWRGRIAVEYRGGRSDRTEHLRVGRRERTKAIDGVLAQAGTVRRVLAGGEYAAVPIRAVLCFVEGSWPMFGRFEVRGVPILPPWDVARHCRADGPLEPSTIEDLAGELARRLPPA